MSRTLYFYSRLKPDDLKRLVEAHQKAFDELLGDSFDDHELEQFEKHLDALGSVEIGPILEEMTFDDFYPDPTVEEAQRAFFQSCESSLCLDNLPYLESNAFQVSYLIKLLNLFDELLIDRGGINQLVFKQNFLEELLKYKNMDSYLTNFVPKKPESKPTRPVDPIEFYIFDVYNEIQRLKVESKLESIEWPTDKLKKIFLIMSKEDLDASELLSKTGLNAKEFDDNLERLKFFLKKQ